MSKCVWELRHRYDTDKEEYWYVVCDTRFTPTRADRDWSYCPYCGKPLAIEAKDKQGKRHLEFIGLADFAP